MRREPMTIPGLMHRLCLLCDGTGQDFLGRWADQEVYETCCRCDGSRLDPEADDA